MCCCDKLHKFQLCLEVSTRKNDLFWPSPQEVTDLKDARQLLIQQKLELQGEVDALKAALDQERRNQQRLQEQGKQEAAALRKEFSEKEAQLVSD